MITNETAPSYYKHLPFKRIY